MTTNYKNLDTAQAFKKLQAIDFHSIDLKTILSPERIQTYKATNSSLDFLYATARINETVLPLFQELSNELNLVERYENLLAGERVNLSENRKVLHHQTRSSHRGFYGEQQKRIEAFSHKIHQGTILGATGKAFKSVVQIGIGGSDLGPRALYIALERYVIEKKGKLPLEASFIANVDPDDANAVLGQIDVETTLFIVVSKSGTTQETLANLAFVQELAIKKGLKKEDLKKHFIAVTGKNSPMDNPEEYLACFYIDDFIGGRYSSTSAVGGAVLSLSFGPEIFEEILSGACAIDDCSKNPDIYNNISLLSALIGVWDRNILGYPAKGIIPYAEALSRFPAHLQQLDCESNGKAVNIYNEAVNYETGPMIFGEPGTNGQHSFFQKIHQGTDVIPLQWIGFKKPQIERDLITFGSYSQEKLTANLTAQVIALARGKDAVKAYDVFSGNRPTTLLIADQLSPFTLGNLLSFYENVVMFQGFIWNINSFDQPGVQLGKVLTGEIMAEGGCKDPILEALYSQFSS